MNKIKCETCKELKHDTAFEFYVGWKFWKQFGIKTEKCLDCKYPHRWDEIREELKKIIGKKK